MNQYIGTVALLLWTNLSMAGVGNVDPFGLELGVATRGQVEQAFKGKPLSTLGENAASGGAMLVAEQPGIGPEGLKKILFVFDKQDRLVGLQMTLPKDFHGKNVSGIANDLARKYVQKSRNLPQVGNGAARFERGRSAVVVEAPHLSFEFTVTYLTEGLERDLAAYEREQKQQKAARSRAAL